MVCTNSFYPLQNSCFEKSWVHQGESQHQHVEAKEHDTTNDNRVDQVLDVIMSKFELEFEDASTDVHWLQDHL
jgi:hypothetical protein